MGALWSGLQPDNNNNKPSVDGISRTLINTLIKLVNAVIYPPLVDYSCIDWWGLRHVCVVAEEEGLEC